MPVRKSASASAFAAQSCLELLSLVTSPRCRADVGHANVRDAFSCWPCQRPAINAVAEPDVSNWPCEPIFNVDKQWNDCLTALARLLPRAANKRFVLWNEQRQQIGHALSNAFDSGLCFWIGHDP